MTDDVEALQERISVLEEAVHQAIWSVEFLHHCLTEPKDYAYSHPEITLHNVAVWRELAPPPTLSFDSRLGKSRLRWEDLRWDERSLE